MTRDDQLLNLLLKNTEITAATATKVDALTVDVSELKAQGLAARIALLEAERADRVRRSEKAEAAKAESLVQRAGSRRAWMVAAFGAAASMLTAFFHEALGSWIGHLFGGHAGGK
jgi:hypothetical protein